MSQPLRVAIQGFSAFERSTFEALFRLSTRNTPAYQCSASLLDCHLVIADGDNPATLPEVRAAGKLGNTLLVGADAHPDVALHLRRPINLMTVVKLLDQIPEAALATAPASPLPAAMPPPLRPEPVSNSQLVLESLARSKIPPAPVPADPGPTQPRRGSKARRPAEPPEPPALPEPAPSPEATAVPGRATMDHILVVDDSDIALRFMANRLERFGFVVHLSRNGEDALARTDQQRFTFVFINVTMPGLDGFKTCKAIKRRPSAAGEAPPTVVMLTNGATPVDQLRGTMAGCDGYLSKPLNEGELLTLIGDREIARHGFAETAHNNRDL